jgi:aurora kinase A
MVKQFATELKIQYRLNHPNIVKLYTHFDDEYHVFLLMEYAPEGNLMAKMHNTEAYTANVLDQIVRAVQYTHNNMVVHRDIKPENIVVFFEVISL